MNPLEQVFTVCVLLVVAAILPAWEWVRVVILIIAVLMAIVFVVGFIRFVLNPFSSKGK